MTEGEGMVVVNILLLKGGSFLTEHWKSMVHTWAPKRVSVWLEGKVDVGSKS